MRLLQVLPLLQKVLLCRVLRALAAPAGHADHGTGPGGTPGSCPGAQQSWQLGGGTVWTLPLLFTHELRRFMGESNEVLRAQCGARGRRTGPPCPAEAWEP